MASNTPHKYFHSEAWASAVSQYLSEQRRLRCLRYKDICAALLNKYNIDITESNLRQRFTSGRLGAQLFVCCLSVMEIETMEINELTTLYHNADTDTADELECS